MNSHLHHRQNQQLKEKAPIILVVEDNEDNLLLISHALILFQYNFVTATDIQTALSIIKYYQPDLILLDIVLAGENGLELVRHLKQNKLHKHNLNIPIIAITALAKKEDCDHLLAEGCDEYLIKPYLLQDLNNKISRYISPYNFPCQHQRNLVSAVA